MLAGSAGWTIVGASAVRAQAWPTQQVRIVVPYIPGGATDTAGRLVAEKMTALLGQQVIVENKGGGNTIRDVLAGHVPMICDVVLPTGNHVKAGRMKGLVVASSERSPVCPDVPTVTELGMPDMVSAVFFGLVAPAATPRPVVDRLNAL